MHGSKALLPLNETPDPFCLCILMNESVLATGSPIFVDTGRNCQGRMDSAYLLCPCFSAALSVNAVSFSLCLTGISQISALLSLLL